MSLWERVQDAPLGAKLAAALGTAVQAVVGDIFVWLLLLLLAANLVDWLAGRHAARLRCEFSKTESRKGVLAKAIAIAVVLIVRAAELINTRFGPELELPLDITVPSTHGLVAAAITAWLIYEEAESLDEHRASLGRRPIPLLSWALGKLRGVTGGERRQDPAREVA